MHDETDITTPPEPAPGTLTEAEFAARVGWHEKTIAKWRRAGIIQHRCLGRRVWYLEEDVAAFHEAFKRAPRARTA